MKNSKGVSKGVKIYFAISVVIVTLLNLHSVVESPILVPKIAGCCGIVSCVLAVIYGLKGFSKDAAKFYKLFMIFAFLTYQLAVCTVGINLNGAFAGVLVGFNCLTASLVLALMLSRDLEKKLSMTFCWIICAITLAEAIAMFIVYPGSLHGGTPEGSIAFFRSCSNFFVAEVIFSMTMAKYQDKTARSTK